MLLLEPYQKKIEEACETYDVKNLEIFGSAFTKDFNTQSDIDLIVDFNPSAREKLFSYYFDLKKQLEAIFNKPVDMIMAGAIKNPYFIKSIEENRVKIYGE